MRLICPSCGAIHSAEAWVNDAEARQCLLIVAELPAEVGRRVLPYLAMFRNSGSGRALTWTKALRLLAELKPLVMDPHIQWDRCPARPNSAGAWSMALEQIVQRPPKQLPLTSHGYLRKIAYDVADQKDKAEEVRRNKAERRGVAGPQRAMPHPDDSWRPSPEDFETARKLISGATKNSS